MHHNELIHSHTAGKTKPLTIALLGNPNCGKSSIFNLLTGLRQKVGNFPGVTVDKKVGQLRIDPDMDVMLVDFPGAYSFYPTSQDERIVVQTFANPADENFPDAVVYIADVTRLEKHLLLFTQLRDLGIPIIIALNMADLAEKEGFRIDSDGLSKQLKAPVVCVSGRTGRGMDELKSEIARIGAAGVAFEQPAPFYTLTQPELDSAKAIRRICPRANDYQALMIAHHYKWLPFLSREEREKVAVTNKEAGFHDLRLQVDETMSRYDRFTPIARQGVRKQSEKPDALTERLDALLTHSVAGPVIFALLMLLVFQAIFAWATYPMELIEAFFGWTGALVGEIFPEGKLTSLITDGILAGLGGIMVFIPQIAILFFLISLLEEVGYMARAAYLFDRLMQAFGLNGRSIVALISGGACAIPAIMTTRTIGNWKERLITIMVTPLISCSARIPVYTVLIGFVIPPATVWGFNLQGLAFMGLYLLGIIAALLSALVFKWILKTQDKSFLMLELPEYRSPVMRNVWLTVWEKVKTFIIEAGKIIMIISVILWVLASFGPPAAMERAEAEAIETARENNMDQTATNNLIASRQIEASYAGYLGKLIEPAIKPLGFDWKIGIALITSFAAREVFVGTMATIYSIGSDVDEYSIRDRMALERNPVTGQPVYNLATSFSLLIFYVFAMMCMSTLAVVKRETKSWKWPIIQFVFMTGLAYLGSLLVYQLLQ
jgi:ferrous iron transport protein B